MRRTTAERVSELHESGLGTNAIAREIGVSGATVSYHKDRLGLPLQVQTRRTNWSELQADLDAGAIYRELEDKHGVSRKTLTEAVADGRLSRRPRSQEMSLEAYAASWNGRPATNGFRRRMRREMVATGVCEDECSSCALDEWMGGRLVLELDHIDGDTTHNLVPNFRLLCLNCHSQTPTWRGRNVRR